MSIYCKDCGLEIAIYRASCMNRPCAERRCAAVGGVSLSHWGIFYFGDNWLDVWRSEPSYGQGVPTSRSESHGHPGTTSPHAYRDGRTRGVWAPDPWSKSIYDANV